MIFYDTETCGFHGMAVLIQYSYDDGEVQLFSPWTEPVLDTLNLIEEFLGHEGGLCAFNIAFDFFHIVKLWTTFKLFYSKYGNEIPEDYINEIAELEKEARDGPCLKPVKALDLMLHARKGMYQSTMDRDDIRIKKVPQALAWQLAAELEKRIPLNDIYFSRKKDKHAERWVVKDIVDQDTGEIDSNFKDLYLKFAPSSGLKALATDALKLPIEEVLQFKGVDKIFLPVELGFAPYALAVGEPGDWKGAWPEVIQHHIDHWSFNDREREYARKDVIYLQQLYKHFGCPEMGDDDSELACMVAAVRWKGFKIDMTKIREMKAKAEEKIGAVPTGPREVQAYINMVLSPTEALVLKGSTNKIALERIVNLTIPCPDCNNEAEFTYKYNEVDRDLVEEYDTPAELLEIQINNSKVNKDCQTCGGAGTVPHKCAKRAQEVLEARAATKEIENYDKLLIADRFHASFKVIGTFSSRMSGTDDLNAQGIKHDPEVRACFNLAWDDMELDAGDFDAFEPSLAEACYDDPVLRADLLTCEKCDGAMRFDDSKKDFVCEKCGSNKGKKIHALFGVFVFTNMTYAQIRATSDVSMGPYDRSKKAILAMFYGGEGYTLRERLGVDIDTANRAKTQFINRYKGVGREQEKVANDFKSMRQVGGLGTKVEWSEPKDYVESPLGHRRYFTLENRIAKTLFELANKPPKHWREIKIKLVRRDREQTASGAVQSALYASAFAIQSSVVRKAINHRIQSFGAQITKKVQRKIWDSQPSGINKWLVQNMNVHDEILCVTDPSHSPVVKRIVNETVESFRPSVPLIKMEWKLGLKSWAEKG